MTENWSEITVTKIALAIYVESGAGRHAHDDRPYHGFVLNDEDSAKDYCFSDGTVLHTEGGDLFYLPKGSTYYVKTITSGGCYAINFDAEIEEEPFAVKLRNREDLRKIFRTAEREWRQQNAYRQVYVMRAVYDIICRLHGEQKKKYVPDAHLKRIAPALERIEADFSENGLSVTALAAECGISEAYLRRIFMDKFGISPKEYIIRLRIDYARRLLESGEFSVGEVAVLCGYFEACHFSREFSRRVGVPPQEYKSGSR